MQEHIKGRLLSNRVIIQQNLADAEVNGIIIAPESQEKKSSGTITQVGPLATKVKIGNTVIYDKGEGTEINKGGVKYIIVREQSIIMDLTANIMYGNRVMIKQNDPTAEIAGFTLALESQLKRSSGKIIMIGDEVQELEPDMQVIYDKYEGMEFAKDEERFIIVREPSVIFIND